MKIVVTIVVIVVVLVIIWFIYSKTTGTPMSISVVGGSGGTTVDPNAALKAQLNSSILTLQGQITAITSSSAYATCLTNTQVIVVSGGACLYSASSPTPMQPVKTSDPLYAQCAVTANCNSITNNLINLQIQLKNNQTQLAGLP